MTDTQRYNTGNELGSNKLEDLSDNAKNIDLFSVSQDEYYQDRKGAQRKTVKKFENEHDKQIGAHEIEHGNQIAAHETEHDKQIARHESEFITHIKGMGWTPAAGSFQVGGTITDRNQTLYDEVSHAFYSWNGALPKVVPAGSTPATAGGVGALLWVDRTDLMLRSDINIVQKCFACVADAVADFSLTLGKIVEIIGYHNGWAATVDGPKGGNRYEVVAAGTGVDDGGSFITLANGLQIKGLFIDGIYTPERFGAKGDDINDDGPAIDSACAKFKKVQFDAVKYRRTSPMVVDGVTMTGTVSETLSTTGTEIVFDIAVTPSTTFAFRTVNNKSTIKNIKFKQKSWICSLNGLRIDRTSVFESCDFSYFNGHGIVLESVDSASRVCYSSNLSNVTCDYNAKHGIVLGGSANTVTLINPRARWNGSPSYGVAPSAAGLYDGIYSAGVDSEYDGNGFSAEPQGNTIIGQESAYNSRYGCNLQRFIDGSIVGGYSEGNKVCDLNLVNVFGSVVSNYMPATGPSINIPGADPLDAGRTLLVYPNQIVIRGRNYGIGRTSLVNTAAYQQIFESLRCAGADGSVYIEKDVAGGVEVQKSGGSTVKWSFGITPVYANSVSFGDGRITPVSTHPTISRSGNTEGATLLRCVTGNQYMEFFVANGGGASATSAAQIVPKNSTTSRSINAGGTVNTNGADYAEYMYKCDGCGDIRKGDIVGINSDGMLTDKFDDAISFAIKSTNPSFVGGDDWFAELPPVKPVDENGHEYDSAEYLSAYSDFNTRAENARAKVDRIAFSGRVPCNLSSGSAGEYVIPARSDSGGIIGITIKTPTMSEYMISVGKICEINNGGITVIVKTT